MSVLSAAKRAQRTGLILVIDFRGRTKLRRELRPGDQKIAVSVKPERQAA